MSTTLWDTNGAEIVKALSAERRAAGALASGLALTLVVVTDESNVAEAEGAATTAAAAHPCRVLIVVRRRLEADDRLDAEVQVGGRLGANEAVVMRMYGRLSLHAESVVLPLLASDAPVVTWWHQQPPDKLAYDALGVLASRRVTDCALVDAPLKGLRRRAKDYAPGDTDLAWTRTTPWRSLLASAFDGGTPNPISAEVQTERGNASAALISGWLQARLGIRTRVTASDGPGITAVELRFADDERLRIDRPDGRMATFSRTGRPDRQLPLKRRELGDLIAEELRRLDSDQPYAEALAAATGEKDLHDRPAMRAHIWRDPVTGVTKKGATPHPVAEPKTATTLAAHKSAALTRDSASPTTSRSTSKKAPAGKGSTKKTAAKKTAATKATPKKTTSKKPASKKTTPKKATPTKATPTKATSKRAGSKKAATARKR
jgi:glucose-6-phosphate dehydrogenase assembly protein OpcA